MDEFADLMEQVRNGSQEAAFQIVEKYEAEILRTVRRHLRQDVRQQVDSQDIAQAVWLSFFDGSLKARLYESPNHLIGMLAGIAQNKVRLLNRQLTQTRKRDVRRAMSLEMVGGPDTGPMLATHDPSPSQIAIARERWERSVTTKPDRIQRMINMRFVGKTFADIAEELDCNERTVRRTMQRLFQEFLES